MKTLTCPNCNASFDIEGFDRWSAADGVVTLYQDVLGGHPFFSYEVDGDSLRMAFLINPDVWYEHVRAG